MLKFLCKLVNLTRSYKRKQKKMFFSENSVCDCLWPWEVFHLQYSSTIQALYAVQFIQLIHATFPWGMEVRKVLNGKHYIQHHSRSLALLPSDRQHDFLLILCSVYVSILSHFQDIITYLPQCKEIMWHWTQPIHYTEKTKALKWQK